MSSVTDLLALAERDRQVNEATNPLFGLARGFEQGMVEERERKKKLEETKTKYAAIQKLFDSEGKDYQNDYKVKPRVGADGSLGFGIGEKDDRVQYNEDLNRGMGAIDLLKKYPSYTNNIETLIKSGQLDNPFIDGTPINSGMQGSRIQPGRQGVSIPPTLPTADVDAEFAQLPNQNGSLSPEFAQLPGEGVQYQSEYVEVPKGTDELGRSTGTTFEKTAESELRETANKKMIDKRAEALSKSKGAERMTLMNLGKLGGAVNELSEVYAGAIEEGGFGNIIKKKIAGRRLWAGGKQADKLKNTAAYSGVLTEVVSNIMPTLTQQGDEKGSVRLVESIFRKVRESFPEGHQYAGAAQHMIRVSLRNAYRKAKVINEMALSNEYIDSLSDEDLDSLSDKIIAMADNIQIDEDSEEGQAIDYFITQSTQPLLDLLDDDKDSKTYK